MGPSTWAHGKADGHRGEERSSQKRGAHSPSRVAATMWRSHAIPSSCRPTPVRRTARPTQLPVSQAKGSAPIHCPMSRPRSGKPARRRADVRTAATSPASCASASAPARRASASRDTAIDSPAPDRSETSQHAASPRSARHPGARESARRAPATSAPVRQAAIARGQGWGSSPNAADSRARTVGWPAASSAARADRSSGMGAAVAGRSLPTTASTQLVRGSAAPSARRAGPSRSTAPAAATAAQITRASRVTGGPPDDPPTAGIRQQGVRLPRGEPVRGAPPPRRPLSSPPRARPPHGSRPVRGRDEPRPRARR